MSEHPETWKRTGLCAEYGLKDAGAQVTLMGWVHRLRDLGSLLFIWLRDRSGIMQVVFDQSRDAALFAQAESLRSEYVIAVRGQVAARSAENVNAELATGAVEVIARELVILNESDTPPFAIGDEKVAEALRLRYRYLDLRRPALQSLIEMKHAVTRAVREFLDAEGFLDIETPILTRSTPEGARDYLVPSRVHPGSFYALPQSPQLFKQLLMAAGFDRYYQIAKCFRDEDLRADRQPEFTQIDMELSFVTEDDVIALNESLLRHVFRTVLDREVPERFPRLTYEQAMARYGSDKPDTRFGLELTDLSDAAAGCGFRVFADTVEKGGAVCALTVPGELGSFSRRQVDELGEIVRTYGAHGLATLIVEEDGARSPIAKFLTADETARITAACRASAGDTVFIVADERRVAQTALGQLRLELGRRLNLIDPGRFDFLWVTHFPMFEYSAEEGRYVAMHHPFTAPLDEDMPLLAAEPGRVRARAYDIVLNGSEIGGGSIRIHRRDVQQRVFAALGISEREAMERFGFLLTAFRYGAPPHGGLAYGLDRLVMLMSGRDSIRDAIAFPKVQSASCLMTDAPGPVDPRQLAELSIAVAAQGGAKDDA
ncbi:MAG: aspartate--tRNA ligase [Christensenellales bacterium]|jgi:aspartyl-tRNA synthetase